jgi:predicted transcriptional regulator
MKHANFNEDQAIVMQVIDEAGGEEDFDFLAETLRFERARVIDILQSLQHKGLIKIRNSGYGTIAALSAKGRKTVHLIWPEMPTSTAL